MSRAGEAEHMKASGQEGAGMARDAAKRRAPRLPIEIAASLSGRSPRPVTVIDLSLGGCLVRCDALLDQGAILDLSMPLEGRALEVKVKVAESFVDGDTLAAGAPQYLAGLEFLGLPGGEQARLRRFLEAEQRRRSARTPAP